MSSVESCTLGEQRLGGSVDLSWPPLVHHSPHTTHGRGVATGTALGTHWGYAHGTHTPTVRPTATQTRRRADQIHLAVAPAGESCLFSSPPLPFHMRLLRGWTRLPGQIRENGVHDLHIASACTLLGDASTYAIPRLHDVEGTAALISSIMLGGSSAFDGLMTCVVVVQFQRTRLSDLSHLCDEERCLPPQTPPQQRCYIHQRWPESPGTNATRTGRCKPHSRGLPA